MGRMKVMRKEGMGEGRRRGGNGENKDLTERADGRRYKKRGD